MKRKPIAAICLVLLIGAAYYNHRNCRYFYPFTTTPSGISYKAMRVGNGRKAQIGEWVQLFLVMKVAHKKREENEEVGNEEVGKVGKEGNSEKNERILINSFNEPQPFFLEFGDALKNKRMAEMIGMVEERQHMICKCSPQQYLGEEHADHLESVLKAVDLKVDDELVVDIKVDKIMTKG